MNKIEESYKTDNESRGNTSNSDSPNEHGKRQKKRSTKKELYHQEREEIIKELNNLLNINENKNYVYLYDIENDEQIKKNINEIRFPHTIYNQTNSSAHIIEASYSPQFRFQMTHLNFI